MNRLESKCDDLQRSLDDLRSASPDLGGHQFRRGDSGYGPTSLMNFPASSSSTRNWGRERKRSAPNGYEAFSGWAREHHQQQQQDEEEEDGSRTYRRTQVRLNFDCCLDFSCSRDKDRSSPSVCCIRFESLESLTFISSFSVSVFNYSRDRHRACVCVIRAFNALLLH